MAIMTESQVYVNCDFCDEYYTTQVLNQKETMKKLRGEGWTFGKMVKCPDCCKKNRGADDATD